VKNLDIAVTLGWDKAQLFQDASFAADAVALRRALGEPIGWLRPRAVALEWVDDVSRFGFAPPPGAPKPAAPTPVPAGPVTGPPSRLPARRKRNPVAATDPSA
jgi:hypothetical protein